MSPSQCVIIMGNCLWQQAGVTWYFCWRSVHDTVRRRTRMLKIRIVLFWYCDDKQMSKLHLPSEVGVPETSREVRTTLLLCLPNRTLCLLYPWEVWNKCLRNLCTYERSGMPEGFFPPTFPTILVQCGISFDKFHDWQLLVPTSWTTTVLDKMRLVGVELVVGLFNMNLLCANYRVADTNHLFSLISPFISTPSLYLSCSQSARLPSQVCRPSPFGLCQPWNVTRTLKTTAAQPTQTQMFSLVVRLNIQEGGTKNRFNRKCWVYEDSLSPRLPWAVSDYASIMLYTPTGDFIRYTCSTQTSYQLITWQQFDLFKAHGYGQENLLRDQKCHLDDLQPADDLDLYLAMIFVQDILMTTFKLRHGWP